MPTEPSPMELTPTQLQIMNLVWEHERCSITFLWSKLGEQRPVARNTVLTLVSRLEQRGWLERVEEGRTHLYQSRVTREATRVGRLRHLVDELFAGSSSELMRSMLGHGMVKDDELKRLRELLAHGKPSAKRNPSGKPNRKRRKR